MKSVRQTYEQRATQFAQVCDLSISILTNAVIAQEEKTRMLNIFKSDKELALNPQPQYKKIVSLKYIEADHFWYWNEHNGQHVNEFWNQLSMTGFDYKRKDILLGVLKKGRISNRIQYDYIIDEILVAEQKGRISGEDSERLNELLLKYETKKK